MVPKYAVQRNFLVRSNIYSFGVLVIEIVSGHKNSSIRHGESKEYQLDFVSLPSLRLSYHKNMQTCWL